MIRRPPRSPLFPYTPLFRSARFVERFDRRFAAARQRQDRGHDSRREPAHPGQELAARRGAGVQGGAIKDRKSTRLNSSHLVISYAVFCLKKKTYNNRLLTSAHSCTCSPVTRTSPRPSPGSICPLPYLCSRIITLGLSLSSSGAPSKTSAT